jgi:hypothetical protein
MQWNDVPGVLETEANQLRQVEGTDEESLGRVRKAALKLRLVLVEIGFVLDQAEDPTYERPGPDDHYRPECLAQSRGDKGKIAPEARLTLWEVEHVAQYWEAKFEHAQNYFATGHCDVPMAFQNSYSLHRLDKLWLHCSEECRQELERQRQRAARLNREIEGLPLEELLKRASNPAGEPRRVTINDRDRVLELDWTDYTCWPDSPDRGEAHVAGNRDDIEWLAIGAPATIMVDGQELTGLGWCKPYEHNQQWRIGLSYSKELDEQEALRRAEEREEFRRLAEEESEP